MQSLNYIWVEFIHISAAFQICSICILCYYAPLPWVSVEPSNPSVANATAYHCHSQIISFLSLRIAGSSTVLQVDIVLVLFDSRFVDVFDLVRNVPSALLLLSSTPLSREHCPMNTRTHTPHRHHAPVRMVLVMMCKFCTIPGVPSTLPLAPESQSGHIEINLQAILLCTITFLMCLCLCVLMRIPQGLCGDSKRVCVRACVLLNNALSWPTFVVDVDSSPHHKTARIYMIFHCLHCAHCWATHPFVLLPHRR